MMFEENQDRMESLREQEREDYQRHND